MPVNTVEFYSSYRNIIIFQPLLSTSIFNACDIYWIYPTIHYPESTPYTFPILADQHISLCISCVHQSSNLVVSCFYESPAAACIVFTYNSPKLANLCNWSIFPILMFPICSLSPLVKYQTKSHYGSYPSS